jgi:hypothetical protein
MANRPKIKAMNFKPPLVKANAVGRKIMTRRPIKDDAKNVIVPDLIWVKEHKNIKREESQQTLRVFNHKIENLHDISENDAWKEGVCHVVEETDRTPWGNMAEEDRQWMTRTRFGSAKTAFHFLWDGCYPGRYRWETNPKVLVLTYKTLLINIDDYLAKEAA